MSRDLRDWGAQHAAEVAAREGMTKPIAIEVPGLVWMAIHGAICLGLRHPEFTGPSREIVVSFVRQLGISLVECDLLTAEELEVIENFERQESPHGYV